MKLEVPFKIPYTFVILFANNPSLIYLTIGTPPHTEASYSRFTFFSSAILAKESPCRAISALLAVTTCFLFFKD